MEEELSNQAGRTGAANASLHLSSLWCWYNECMNMVAMKARTEDESRRRKQSRIRLCEERAGREKFPRQESSCREMFERTEMSIELN